MLYETENGKAYVADSLQFMPTLRAESVNLIMTSPPFALQFKKEYGNASQDNYVKWFLPFAGEFKRLLTKDQGW